jgi:hypothetical protein
MMGLHIFVRDLLTGTWVLEDPMRWADAYPGRIASALAVFISTGGGTAVTRAPQHRHPRMVPVACAAGEPRVVKDSPSNWGTPMLDTRRSSWVVSN